MKKIIFWGAGTIGKRMISTCTFYGLFPDFLVDSDSEKQGKIIAGMKVGSPEEVLGMDEIMIFVTCLKVDEVKMMLRGKKRVFDGTKMWMILNYMPEWLNTVRKVYGNRCCFYNNRVAFLLENGLTTGGAEIWSVQSGEQIKDFGYEAFFLIPLSKSRQIHVNEASIISICDEQFQAGSVITRTISNLIKKGVHTLICNFDSFFFDAACILKMLFSDIRVIAVIHSDDKGYYESYGKAKDLIDICMPVSQKTQKKIEREEFGKEKIKKLMFFISTREKHIHLYSAESDPIRIGYVGRITVIDKRADLLMRIAQKLYQKQIRFVFCIVGIGDYYEYMKAEVNQTEWGKYVRLLGRLEQKEIPSFWEKQDICISCSEREGNSISKKEAMASGVVPIMTDTSGVRDDIKDGINGFIVPVGDLDMIIKRIEFLYERRERLALMGKEARKTICDYSNIDWLRYWADILD